VGHPHGRYIKKNRPYTLKGAFPRGLNSPHQINPLDGEKSPEGGDLYRENAEKGIKDPLKRGPPKKRGGKPLKSPRGKPFPPKIYGGNSGKRALKSGAL